MNRKTIITVLVVLAVAAWARGAFDYALAPLGMNARECQRNGLGVTYCGPDLKAYKKNVVAPLQAAQDQAAQDARDAQDAAVREAEAQDAAQERELSLEADAQRQAVCAEQGYTC